MFDIGWSEMMVVAVLVLIIMGPKELPQTLRTITAFIRKGKELAGEFRSGVNDLVREADLEGARDAANNVTPHSLRQSIESVVDPEQSLKKSAVELTESIQDATRPLPSETSSEKPPQTQSPAGRTD